MNLLATKLATKALRVRPEMQWLSYNSLKEVFMPRFVVLLLLATSLLSGQIAPTASLTGTVTDPSGAVIPSAHVQLVSIETGFKRAVEAQSDGRYLLGMHLTQVAPAGSMVAKWKITRERCRNSKPVFRPRKGVASTSFGCGGRTVSGAHVAEVARRGRCGPRYSSVRAVTTRLR